MSPEDDPRAILQEQGRLRRELGERLRDERDDPLDLKLLGEWSPDHIGTRSTSTGLLVRTFRYPCGHEHATALLTPPKECPACRKERYARDNEEALRRRLLSLMARSAAERAERAHVYRKRHLICRLCFLSRAADAKTLCEAHAGIFSWRDPWRGFKIENGGAA